MKISSLEAFNEAMQVHMTIGNKFGTRIYILTYKGYIKTLYQKAMPATSTVLRFKRECDKRDAAY